VLSAARALFRQLGYERVGIRDIAAEIGMSTGAVFNSFENKEELFAGATASRRRRPPTSPSVSRAAEERPADRGPGGRARLLRLHLIGRAK
jgi:AcrR family transcriptional regulator